MSAPSSEAEHRRHRLLLALATLVAIALMAALATVAWLQVRQHRLLDATVRYQDDYLQISIAQVQAEYFRLRSALHEALADPGAAREAVQLRYDIFVSRVDLLATGRAERLMPDAAEFRGALSRTRAFIDHADRYLGPTPAAPLDAAAVQGLLKAMPALDAPLQTLVLNSQHTVSAAVAERYDQVRDQGRLGVLLTALLSATSVGFALLAMALLRREWQRRRALETLTAELQLAQQAAEGASHAKSAFLANMSHEIRTPFQGMLGMLQVLEGGAMQPTQRRQLETVRNSASHLLAVLDDMLDLSRLEAGTIVLEPAPLDLRALLADVHALMSAPAQAKGLRFELPRLDDALPREVLLDGTRVRQILFNLVSNAIKFTDRGTVGIEVRMDGEDLRVSVSDTGTGIDAATRARLFERFSLGDASRSRRHGGMGLGLYISRSLARLMGGDIVVQTAPGEGSRFELRLPARPVKQTTTGAAEAAAGMKPAPRPLNVLAAEDNEINRLVLAAMLEQQGHHVRFAGTGREAVDAVARGDADIVLMDLHMPEMDGIEATRIIRRLAPPMAGVPIIALSADVFPQTRALCAQAGMNDFLAKPVDIADLSAMLARHGAQSVTAAEAGSAR